MMRLVILIAVTVLAATGCIPKRPKTTSRPETPVAPWEEKTIKSTASCQTYNYLYLPGPSEDAPPLLLLPGGFFDNRIWLYMNDLAKHFRVYAIDWPHNSSFFSGNVSDLGDMALDFARAVGVKDLYVAGVSNGAYAAIDLASKKGADIEFKAVFLFSAVMLAVNEKEVEKRKSASEMALDLPPNRARALIEWGVRRNKYDKAPGKVQALDIFYVRPYTYYFQIFSAAVNQGGTPQATKQIKCPVLLMHGSDDEVMPVESARLSTPLFQDAEYREFKGYRHSMVFSHGPEMTATMVDFLTRKGLLK